MVATGAEQMISMLITAICAGAEQSKPTPVAASGEQTTAFPEPPPYTRPPSNEASGEQEPPSKTPVPYTRPPTESPAKQYPPKGKAPMEANAVQNPPGGFCTENGKTSLRL